MVLVTMTGKAFGEMGQILDGLVGFCCFLWIMMWFLVYLISVLSGFYNCIVAFGGFGEILFFSGFLLHC